MNNTLLDWLATGPDKQKLVSFNHTNIIKGQDFCDKVSCFYSQLQQHPEQRWLLSAYDSSIFAAALCAGLLAGKTIILPANTQPGTIANIEHAFDGILSTQELSKNHPFIPLNQAITKSNSSWPRAASLGDIVLYTSGSSGQPKSVTKSLTQLDAEVSTLEQTFASAMGQCSIISTVSHQHIYGLLFTVLWPLCTQRPFLSELIAYPETLSYYLTLMPNLCLISSPAQLSRLPNALENQLQQQSPRLIFSSGGALSANAAQGMFNCYHQFPIEVFGSTETGGIAYRQQTTSQTPWQVFTGISIKQAANGALQIQSPYLPNSTTWHTCDDSVELLSPEQFTLLGRLDRTVKVAEKRVSLVQMEQLLMANVWISDASVVLLEGTRRMLGAIIVLTPEGQKELASLGKLTLCNQIKQHLSEQFERVTLPRKWRIESEIPQDTQGKRSQALIAQRFSIHD